MSVVLSSTRAIPPARWPRVATLLLNAGWFILAAAILGWGAMARFRLPQTPIIDPDIRGYLGPALLALTGKSFVHLDGRSFPYPAFVWVVLRLFGDFRALAVIQHLLGLCAGLLVMLTWAALVRLIPCGGIPRPVARYFGFAPAAIYLGSTTAILFEHEIRPEALFPFLTILDLFLTFLFFHARFARPRRSAIWLGGLVVFVTTLIYLLKPSFGLAAAFATLPVWLSLLLPGPERSQKLWLGTAAILPAFFLLLLPEQLLKRSDIWGRQFLPETLFSVHASIILDQMTRDLAENTPSPYPRPFLQSTRDLLQSELADAARVTTPKAFTSLGYNPDYLMYDSFCVKFAKITQWDPAELVNFYNYEYRRALTRQPGAMLRKIEGQLALFYNDKLPIYRLGQNLKLSEAGTDENNMYLRIPALMASKAQVGTQYPPLVRYVEQSGALGNRDIAITQVKRFTEWTRLLSSHYLDLLVVAFLSPLLLLWPRLRSHLLWIVIALWLAASYTFGNCLTIAIVHSLEVTRYVRIQLIYTVLTQFLALYLLVDLAAWLLRTYALPAAFAGSLRPPPEEPPSHSSGSELPN